MSSGTATQSSNKPAPAPRRWSVRFFLGLATAAIFVVFGVYLWSIISTSSALAEAEAEARRDLPRWRLLELEEDRPEIPVGENSALFMIGLLPKIRAAQVTGVPNYEEIFAKLPPNVELNAQQEKLIRNELTKIPGPLADARQLKDMPRGRFPIKYSEDFISTLLPNHQDARQFADLLLHDAYLLAHDNEADKAIESCRAILNAGRAFDGELTLIAHLIRVALQHRMVIAFERVLAQTEPSDAGLRELQTAFANETKECSLVPAVRGERAGINHLFENIHAGKINSTQLRGLTRPGGGVSAFNVGLAEIYPRSLSRHYPEYLHWLNRAVEASKLPIHERQTALKAMEDECKATSNVVMHVFAPAFSKVGTADARGHALLRSAMVAAACERYRQANKGVWPESLETLGKAKLLDEIPRDPFDNQPLRYRRTNDGAVIYSVGVDLKDDGGVIDHDRMNLAGVDIGVRLWNVNQRRQRPLPPVVIMKQD